MKKFGTIVDFLYFLSPNKTLYAEVIAMVNNFIKHDPDINDLACFIKWLYIGRVTRLMIPT